MTAIHCATSWANWFGPTGPRYERLLKRSAGNVNARTFDRHKYEPTRPLAGASVLLIDDTWTTGANAQSAAAALKRAGAGPVGAVVIGRHLNREWHENDHRLRRHHEAVRLVALRALRFVSVSD